MADEIDATTFSSASVDLTSDAASQTMTRGKIQCGPSIKQSFAFPESIMYYIAKNPLSINGYLKMVKSCKFFFERNPILIATRLHMDSKICSKTYQDCESNGGKCCMKLDINKFSSNSSKIWLTEALILDENTATNYATLLSSKLYRCENDILELHDKTIFLDDFKFMASSVTCLDFKNVTITNHDGSIVSIDEVLKYVPKLNRFIFYFSNVESTSTLKDIAKLTDLKHLKCLFLIDIPQIFTIKNISNFIKAHKDMSLLLKFDNTISEEYKDQLDDLIDFLLESELCNKIIDYDGQDEEKFIMMKIRMATFFDALTTVR